MARRTPSWLGTDAYELTADGTHDGAENWYVVLGSCGEQRRVPPLVHHCLPVRAVSLQDQASLIPPLVNPEAR